MKRGMPEHPKTDALAQRLQVSVAHAVGLVEMLCNHFAPRFAPQGDVGKWSNLQIARGLKTDLDADALVEALAHAGFLDVHAVHRLVIHDWHVHADRGVKNRLKFEGLRFAVGPGSDRGRTRVEPRSDPGRPGSGSGSGGSSFSGPDPESGARPRAKVAGWRTVPPGEALTDVRQVRAAAIGLSPAAIRWQWDKFVLHEFHAPHSDVDRSWAKWCMGAVERGERDAPGSGGKPAAPRPLPVGHPLRVDRPHVALGPSPDREEAPKLEKVGKLFRDLAGQKT